MDDNAVGRYLISKQYNLTALELMSEVFERTGVTIGCLSTYFQQSANFLSFDSPITLNPDAEGPNTTVSEAVRVRNDRIAILEHELSVLQDRLREAESKPPPAAPREHLDLKSPSSVLAGTEDAGEEAVLKKLIGKYLHSHGFRITSVSFASEVGRIGQTPGIAVPDDLELVSLLRSFLYLQNTSKAHEQIESLKRDKLEARDRIAQLTVDLDVAKRRIVELDAMNERLRRDAEAPAAQTVQVLEVPVVPAIAQPSEPPSVQLLDAVLSDIRPLIPVVDRANKSRLLPAIKTVLKNHPNRKVRMDCIQIIIDFFGDDPTPDEVDCVVGTLRECSTTPEKVEGEVLPFVTQLMASTSPSVLCMLSKLVAAFATVCSVILRSTLMLSIVRQLSEHSSPDVRAASARDAASLVGAFGEDENAAEKLHDLVELGRLYVFDPESAVQVAGLTTFIPAIVRFAQTHKCVGRTLFEYWLKIAMSNGLTGSSQLAVLRFKLACQVLEIAINNMLPSHPRDDQTIVCDGPAAPEHVVAPKAEYDWIKGRLPEILTRIAPLLGVQIPVKKEATRLSAKCCQAMGKHFLLVDVIPAFTKLIETGPLVDRMHGVAFFLAGIACLDEELFLAKTRVFINYCVDETHDFKWADLQNSIAGSLAVLSGRELSSHAMILRIVDGLSREKRGAMKSAAITIVSELLYSLDQREIETDVIPIIGRFANDLDEALQMETVNCCGRIARFTTSATVMRTVRELFDDWFKGKPIVRLQVLRTLTSNAGDIDSQFRDTYILPKLVECVQPAFGWEEVAEQAYVIVIQFVVSLKDQFSDVVVRGSVLPIIQALSENSAVAGDPMLKDLRDTYKGEKGNRLTDFFQKS
jgi:hypothetical protein